MDRYEVIDGRIRTDACEINVVHHCNLACRSCSHVSPVLRRTVADPDTVYRDLSLLAPHYRPDHVRLLGGEPLLHPALHRIVDAVRSSGVSERIRVITNGVFLARMTDELWDGIDELHVSLYPGFHLAPRERRSVDARAAAHRVAVHWKQFDYFRQSYSELGTDDDGLVREIFATCQIAHVWRCHNVVDGVFYRCPQSYFLPGLLHEGGREGDDGLPIVDDPGFGRMLLCFLTDDQPLFACRNCLGSVGKLFPHQQVGRGEFRRLQVSATEELVDREHLELLLTDDPGASNRCVTHRELSMPDLVARS